MASILLSFLLLISVNASTFIVSLHDNVSVSNIFDTQTKLLHTYNIGDFGTYNINNQVQYIVNPPRENELFHTIKKDRVEISFKKGDLNINKKNDYKALPIDSWLCIGNHIDF